VFGRHTEEVSGIHTYQITFLASTTSDPFAVCDSGFGIPTSSGDWSGIRTQGPRTVSSQLIRTLVAHWHDDSDETKTADFAAGH
jgi:hypothetical protein